MKLRAPTQSTEKEGHYKTFLEECLSIPNTDMQASRQLQNIIWVCVNFVAIILSPPKRKKRDMSVFHRCQKKANNREALHVCNFASCGQRFSSVSSLNRHKKKCGHTARDIRQQNPVDKTKQKRRQQKKKNALVRKRLRPLPAAINFSSSDSVSGNSDGDEDASCQVQPCMIVDSNVEDILWLRCMICDWWCLAYCVELGEKSKQELADMEFQCQKCMDGQFAIATAYG